MPALERPIGAPPIPDDDNDDAELRPTLDDEDRAAALQEFGACLGGAARSYCGQLPAYPPQLLLPWTLFAANAQLRAASGAPAACHVLAGLAKAELLSACTLSRSASPSGLGPEGSFTLYNVLGVWLGLVQVLAVHLLTVGGLTSLEGGLSLARDACGALLLAYTLLWTMTVCKEKALMRGALLVMLCCLTVDLFALCTGHLLAAPFFLVKALCDALMLLNGYWLHQDVAGLGGGSFMM